MQHDLNIYVHLSDFENDTTVAGDSEKSDGYDVGKDLKNATKKIVSYAAVKATADRLVSGQISQVELTTGASEYQQRLQTGYSVGKQVLGAAESMTIGFMAGGPIGAFSGLLVSGMNTLIGYSQRAQELGKMQNLEDISIGMMKVRAGSSGRRTR